MLISHRCDKIDWRIVDVQGSFFYRLGIRMTADSLAEDTTVEKVASNQIR